VEAGRWALDNMHKPVVMICGGSDKKLDYTPLRPVVKNKVKHMIVFGEIKSQLRDTFTQDVDVKVAGTLDEVIQLAKKLAGEGDAVLGGLCRSASGGQRRLKPRAVLGGALGVGQHLPEIGRTPRRRGLGGMEKGSGGQENSQKWEHSLIEHHPASMVIRKFAPIGCTGPEVVNSDRCLGCSQILVRPPF
jgi:hypothetical protein